MRIFSSIAFVFLVACGGRTPIKVGPPPSSDGGTSDGFEVRCAEPPAQTTPLRPVALDASIPTSQVIVDREWSVTSAPAGSMPSIQMGTGQTATLIAERPGVYVMRFEATDAGGEVGHCEVSVEVVSGPVALCPAGPLRTTAGEALPLSGDALGDDITAYRWSVEAGPAGALLMPREEATTTFTASARGRYAVALTVTGDAGASSRCEVIVEVTALPALVCPATLEGPLRAPIPIEVRGMDGRLEGGRFALVEQPEGSRPSFGDVDVTPDGSALRTSLRVDLPGIYVVRFVAEGTAGTCDVMVRALDSLPVLRCPPLVETRPLVETPIDAVARDDGILRLRWEVVARPEGSDAAPPTPAERASTRFRPDLAGTYVLRLVGEDEDGGRAQCETRVLAVATEGLRVEMFWSSDDTDMDLHLLSADARRWFDRLEDCYYANCEGSALDWGVSGRGVDDPSLDIDDTDGRGPENINVALPAEGEYRIGVHAFNGNGAVTVRLYCGETTEPIATYGPTRLLDSQFWRVADVSITRGRCRTTDLSRGGRPNITSDNDAERRR